MGHMTVWTLAQNIELAILTWEGNREGKMKKYRNQLDNLLGKHKKSYFLNNSAIKGGG